MTSLFGGMLAVWLLLLVLEIGLVVYALVDLMRQNIEPAMKMIWVAVIILLPVMGSIASIIVNHSKTASTA